MIWPSHSCTQPYLVSVVSKSPSPSHEIGSIVMDYWDLTTKEDNKWQEKFVDFKMKTSVHHGLFHHDDIKTVGLASGSHHHCPARRPSHCLTSAPTTPAWPRAPSISVSISVHSASTIECDRTHTCCLWSAHQAS